MKDIFRCFCPIKHDPVYFRFITKTCYFYIPNILVALLRVTIISLVLIKQVAQIQYKIFKEIMSSIHNFN